MIKIISGNWKMNGSIIDIDNWFKDFFNRAIEFEKTNKKNISDILICLPYIYIPYAIELANEYNKKTTQFKVFIGSEDCHYEHAGAFTGNVSSLMLKEFNIKYSLVGHSERREFEKETSEIVLKKAMNVLSNNITPIVCIGESLTIRENKEHLEFIKKQVIESTKGLNIKNIIVAYEPIWAIGTGKVPTLEEIEEMILYIKKVLSEENNINEDDVNVIYGGSVKSSNTKDITAIKSINGVLVGGASLKGEEFFNIVVNSL